MLSRRAGPFTRKIKSTVNLFIYSMHIVIERGVMRPAIFNTVILAGFVLAGCQHEMRITPHFFSPPGAVNIA
jgi:hypothetical protein